jgi:CubicO group peptidase (beta-lactamase class C family)
VPPNRTAGRRILIAAGWIVLWTCAILAAVGAEAIWFARPSVERGDVASIELHLVRKLGKAVEDGRLGSAALVLVHGGEIVAEHGFGIANAETREPVNPNETLYILGSVSKAVTAWGVMKLVEDGLLGLDEPVVRRLRRWSLPGSEPYRDAVTARHLLSHTAGIDDGFGFVGFLPDETVQTVEESLTFPKDTSMGEPHGVAVVRRPGTTMSYSSAGYTVLQLLIEEITQRSFADYMREAVLLPLGMTRSSYDLDAIVAAGHTRDLATSYDADLEPQPHRRYAAQAAVSLRTTPHELALFVAATTNGEGAVLEPETLKSMLTPQPGTGGTWGLGHELYLPNDAGGHLVGHSGSAAPASGASVRVNPATGNGFVLVSSGGRGATNRLVHDWTYWETGTVTREAQLQVVQDRARPALLAIAIGAISIAAWKCVT